MRHSKQKQQKLIGDEPKAYGGDLLTKRKARLKGRPLAIQHSMHFVLRSTQARGDWSFWRHKKQISDIITRFAVKNGVRLNSIANVGNHLHLHLQLTNRHTYRRFIRAISSAIMMQVTGISRWNKINLPKKFWDRRPFSRVVIGYRAIMTLRDYIKINQMQGRGFARDQARFYVSWNNGFESSA